MFFVAGECHEKNFIRRSKVSRESLSFNISSVTLKFVSVKAVI